MRYANQGYSVHLFDTLTFQHDAPAILAEC